MSTKVCGYTNYQTFQIGMFLTSHSSELNNMFVAMCNGVLGTEMSKNGIPNQPTRDEYVKSLSEALKYSFTHALRPEDQVNPLEKLAYQTLIDSVDWDDLADHEIPDDIEESFRYKTIDGVVVSATGISVCEFGRYLHRIRE